MWHKSPFPRNSKGKIALRNLGKERTVRMMRMLLQERGKPSSDRSIPARTNEMRDICEKIRKKLLPHHAIFDAKKEVKINAPWEGMVCSIYLTGGAARRPGTSMSASPAPVTPTSKYRLSKAPLRGRDIAKSIQRRRFQSICSLAIILSTTTPRRYRHRCRVPLVWIR